MVLSVAVTADRLPRWVSNFAARHGETALSVDSGGLRGAAADGSWFTARLPFDADYDGDAIPEAFASSAAPPADWAVLLVRKGGFAVARLSHGEMVASKVGQRHVQGRTKAGGQSQQRFARRRDNQARAAYLAAAEHARRVVADAPVLLTGGDRPAVEAVLAEAALPGTVVEPWLAVPDPRRAVLDQAIGEAQAIRITLLNA